MRDDVNNKRDYNNGSVEKNRKKGVNNNTLSKRRRKKEGIKCVKTDNGIKNTLSKERRERLK